MALTNKPQKVSSAQAITQWWIFLIQGIALIFIGWLLFAQPVRTTITLIVFLGFYWLISGIIDVIYSLFEIKQEGSHWGWKLVGGTIGIIAGLFILNNPLYASVITPVILTYIIVFTFIINGIINMAVGRQSEHMGNYEWSWGNFFLGLLYFIVGVTLLAAPVFYTTATVFMLVSLLTLVGGIILIIFSFRLKGNSA